jgi:hypothetical protein
MFILYVWVCIWVLGCGLAIKNIDEAFYDIVLQVTILYIYIYMGVKHTFLWLWLIVWGWLGY